MHAKLFSLTVILLPMFLSVPATGHAQIRTSWFDINPSQTNGTSPNGSSGGRVNHLGSTKDLSTVYAASEWGGLWNSADQGKVWHKVTSYLPSATWDVKVDPRSNSQVYATSFFDGKVNSGGTRNSLSGLSVSVDGGNSWSNAPLPTLNCAVATRAAEPSAWQIAIDPQNPDNVFVGTNCGLARTFTSGQSWDYVDPTPSDPAEQIYAVFAAGNGLVDVIGDNGFYSSSDAGNTWTAPINGPGGGVTASIAASPFENYVLFATNGTNILESTDGGHTWPFQFTIPNGNAQGRITFVKTVPVDATHFNLFYGDVDLYQATGTTPANPAPGGPTRVPLNSWTLAQNGAHNDGGDVLFDPRVTAGCPLLYSNDGGVYLNQNTVAPACQTPNWTQPDTTIHATWVYGFDGTKMGPPGVYGLYYALQDNGVWGTINAGEGVFSGVPAWNNPDCCDAFVDAAQSDRIIWDNGFFSPGRAFRIFKAQQNFGSPAEIPNYPSNAPLLGWKSERSVVDFAPYSMAVVFGDPVNSGTLGGIYGTDNIDDNPINWINMGIPTTLSQQNYVGGLQSSWLNGAPVIFYHSGSFGTPGNPDGAGEPGQLYYKNVSAQGNWTMVPLPAGISDVTVYGVNPGDANHIMVCGISPQNSFSMWATANLGTNWTQMNSLNNLMTGNGLYENRVNTGPTPFTTFGSYWQPFMIALDSLNVNTAVAGAADAGLFLTTDFGNTWTTISNSNSSFPASSRPLFAYFSPQRLVSNTLAFDIWIAGRGSGVQKVVIESP